MNLPSITKYLPKLQGFLFIVIFAAVLLLGNNMLNLDGDLPRHLVTGKYILQSGHLPQTEPFVYPYENKAFVSQQWLAGVIFYLIYQLGGLSGIVVFSAILLAGTFSLLYSSLVKRLDLRIPILLLVILGAATTSLSWITRPHLISMFFLSIWLIWGDKLRRGENIPIWYFPVLMLFWTNIHGEFISGILVLFAYATGSIIDYMFMDGNKNEIKRTWLALLFSSLITVLNPGGIDRWAGMLGFMNNQYMMSRMMETTPPNFQDPELSILLGLIAFSIFILSFKRRKISAGQSLLLAGFTAMSLMAFRNIHLYGIVAPFVLSESLLVLNEIPFLNKFEQNLKNIEMNITRGFILPIATLLVLIALVYVPNVNSRIYKFDAKVFPVQAVEWLKSHPQEGHMFNDLNWGGYISFNLWPSQMTFADSVADISGDLTMKYESVSTLRPDWETILNTYDVQWAIIPTQSVLANELKKTSWAILYQDETAVILHSPTE